MCACWPQQRRSRSSSGLLPGAALQRVHLCYGWHEELCGSEWHIHQNLTKMTRFNIIIWAIRSDNILNVYKSCMMKLFYPHSSLAGAKPEVGRLGQRVRCFHNRDVEFFNIKLKTPLSWFHKNEQGSASNTVSNNKMSLNRLRPNSFLIYVPQPLVDSVSSLYTAEFGMLTWVYFYIKAKPWGLKTCVECRVNCGVLLFISLMFLMFSLCFDRIGRTPRAPAPASLLVPTWALIGLVSGSMLISPLLFMLWVLVCSQILTVFCCCFFFFTLEKIRWCAGASYNSVKWKFSCMYMFPVVLLRMACQASFSGVEQDGVITNSKSRCNICIRNYPCSDVLFELLVVCAVFNYGCSWHTCAHRPLITNSNPANE